VDASCPDIYQHFEEAPFPGSLVGALKAAGFPGPTPIQAVAWPLVVAGRDVVAVAKTGSGKTCGYLLPALARLQTAGPAPPPRSEMSQQGYWVTDAVTPAVAVLAPTRELAIQIGEEASKFARPSKAHVVCVYGGCDKRAQLQAFRAGCDVVVATPGRLNDFLEPAKGRSAPISCAKVNYLVLDEADRMLDMGFEPQIKRIVALCLQGGARQTLLFTATWPKSVAAIAASLTRRDAAHVRIGDNGSRLCVNASVRQHVEVLPSDAAKLGRLKELLKASLGPAGRAIVFAGTKRKCEQVALMLHAAGFPVAGSIHGDKTQEEREASLKALRAGAKRILVATDVAARGLDIQGVSMVIILDFPREVADYVHRVGRTGRAGSTGDAHTFLTAADSSAAKQLLTLLRDSAGTVIPPELEAWAKASRGGGGGGARPNAWRGGRGGGGGGRGGGGRRW